MPTEIFAHKEIESIETSGKYEIEEIEDGTYVVKVTTEKGANDITIRFKGEGFSYTSAK